MGSASAVNEADLVAATDKLLADHADDTSFLGAQFDAGLARVDFPVGHGGLDAPPALQVTVERALAAGCRAPTWGRQPMGIGMVAPTIVTWGTEEQRRRFAGPSGFNVFFLDGATTPDDDDWAARGRLEGRNGDPDERTCRPRRRQSP